MKRNVGGWDRRARWVVGGAALASAFLGRRRAWGKAALLVAGSELFTAVTRYCPLNQAFGINTAGERQGKGISLPKEAVTHGEIVDGVHEITSELAYQRLTIVNVVFWGRPDHWVLIDAGLMRSAARIKNAAENRFGTGTKPAAIVLTHGHFDHVGALRELAETWDVPIYAHELELPYLNGQSSYPPPDPSVGGGMMARMAGWYPRGPVDVSRWLRPLPTGGTVPEMHGWQWIPTPGHTPGHVSLWHEDARLLIAGDAIVTTRQESAYAVVRQMPELNGPPKYYTEDWELAAESVRRLAALAPQTIVSGHGPAITGMKARSALKQLAHDFESLAVPEQGRYVQEPASTK